MKFSRRGIGEIAGSLSMLVVTMALLTAASFLSFASVKAGASMLTAGAEGKAIAAGQTVEQAQAGILMDNYKGWEFYDQQRPQNVAGTYRALTSNR